MRSRAERRVMSRKAKQKHQWRVHLWGKPCYGECDWCFFCKKYRCHWLSQRIKEWKIPTRQEVRARESEKYQIKELT